MPDHAFSKISSMAGPQTPARHQTLNEFLKLTVSVPFNRSAVIEAVESNTELLRHCLTFVSVGGQAITRWHDDLSDRTFQDLALTLGNSLSQEALDSPRPEWQRARLAHLLSIGLGQALSQSESEVRRLGLLSELLTLGEAEQDGAEWLRERGVAPADCDVLKFQQESLEVLKFGSVDLVIVALAGRVADAMLNNFDLSDEYYELLNERFDIAGEQVHQIFERAYVELRVENDRMLGRDDFVSRLAKANLAQQFAGSVHEEALLELANKCFGVSAIALAIVESQTLKVNYQEENFIVGLDNHTSVLTQAYETQSDFSAEENALVAIVDKQIQSRMAASALWLLPLATGVVVCSIPNDAPERDAYLVQAFSFACQRLMADETPELAMIGLDEVQTRVRELTHEVNNPLAIVQNYLKTLSLRLGADDAAQTDIKTISNEMLRIGGIIQKYAQIGQEENLDAELVDLNQVVTGLVGVIRGANPDMRVATNLDEHLPQLSLRLSEFKQVLLNLMKNGAEALEGQENACLELATNGQVNLNGAHYIEVTVTDNGPGIPQDIYQNLFSANNSSKGEDHSGIGLSVANRLIMEMGGYISCRSGRGGTQFQILLPITFEQE